jgi:hypothetical protein
LTSIFNLLSFERNSNRGPWKAKSVHLSVTHPTARPCNNTQQFASYPSTTKPCRW